MNDDLRDAAFRAGVWQFIEQRAKEMKDAAKAELAALEPGDAVAGKWNGQTVAKATMSAGRRTLRVNDGAAFVNWLREYHPTEVVESWSPAYLEHIKEHSKGVDFPIDADGVVVPGVEWVDGNPYVSVRKADGAEEIIAELFRSGNVQLEGIQPALEAS